MLKRLLLILFIFCIHSLYAQKQVAITMDDMPFNVLNIYTIDSAISITDKLLNQILNSNTPVTGFITGKKCLNPIEPVKSLQLLLKWINHPLITLGNHTTNHYYSSKISLDTFKMEVIQNHYLISSLAGQKSLKYFRFPYNSTGKDSVSQQTQYEFLRSLNYQIAPFTIESSDYVYDALYVNELNKGNRKRADSIAEVYIKHTIDQFKLFETFSSEIFKRPIKHIYLCHANKLHSDYYGVLINELRKVGYSFISMDEAMTDPAYDSNEYFNKHGVSWIFRWIPDKKTRISYMRKELEVGSKLYEEYRKL